MSYLSPNLTNLIAAVKKAAASLARDFIEIENLQSSVKDYRNFVMNGYNKADRTLRTELSRLHPNFAFAEDGKARPQGGYYVISTISGMTNFIHAIPYFSVSVAMCENNTTLAAVIYNPVSDELFFAEKGMGAYKEGFRNHERLRVSARKELSDSLILTTSSHHENNFAAYSALNNKLLSSSTIRLQGDPNLDLCNVASGKADAFVSYALSPSDITAGILLVKEAGGYIFDIAQKDIRSEDISSVILSGDIIAVNGNLNNKLYELINK